MSAIGTYVRIRRSDLERCIKLAATIHRETPGRWPWTKSVEFGRREFDHAWQAGTIEQVEFGYSGYVLNDYLTAQEAINGYAHSPFDSTDAMVLEKAFAAAFPIFSPMSFPELPDQALLTFCVQQYGQTDASTMFEAIQAAHEFYRSGIAGVTSQESVVFVISLTSNSPTEHR